MENISIEIIDHDKVKEGVLLQAVRTGDYEKLDKLLRSGISIKAENLRQTFPGSIKYPGTLLHAAVASGYVKCVEILINYGVNLEEKNKFGCTALHLASQNGHYPCLKMLLEAGADCCVPIDMPICDRITPYVKGTTALHLASKFNHVTCIEELIQHGANCDAVDKNGCTSLYIAARSGNSECVLTLLRLADSSFFLSFPSYDTSDTPLHFAVKNGMLECVKELVHLGCDVNHVNNLGFSPLHSICCSGGHEYSQLFPMHFKCYSGVHKDIKMQILKILVLEGHNTDIRNASREILFLDCDAELKVFLIAYGANINIKSDVHNLTLLEHELACHRNLEPVCHGNFRPVCHRNLEPLCHRNLHLLKCIVNCMPQLPHLKSLNLRTSSLSFPEENLIQDSFVLNDYAALNLRTSSLSFPENNMIQDSFVLNDYAALRLFRGRRGMYIGINYSNAQVINPSPHNLYNGQPPSQDVSFSYPYPGLASELVNGPDQVFPLRQPYLNLAYEHVNGELKKLEHMENISDVGTLAHKDQLLELKHNLWYERMASTPRTLQHWCRFSIRECMGPSNLKHIKKLPLPEKLLSYILFECEE